MSKPDYHAAAAEVERLIADGLSQDNARKAVKAAHPALHGASLRRAHNALKARARAADTSSPTRHEPPLTLVSKPTDAWGDVLARLKRQRFVTVCHVSDCHFPYEDNDALALCYQTLDYLKPDIAVILSDGADFPTISKFTPDPDIPNGDILKAFQPHWDKHVDDLSACVPTMAKYAVLGNHDYRLFRYLSEVAPQVRDTVKGAFIDTVQSRQRVHFPQLLGEVDIDCLTVFHGDGATTTQNGAKAQLDRRGGQRWYMSGHAHKFKSYDFEGAEYPVGSVVGGCHSILVPHYHKLSNRTDWQQGYWHATIDLDARFVTFQKVRYYRVNGWLRTTVGTTTFSQRVQHGVEDLRDLKAA